MGTIALIILCSVLMVVGLLGVILPVLPGIPLSWLGLFIYALGTSFERISIATVVIFFILTVFTLILDFVAPMLGAKKYQASKLGIFGFYRIHHRNLYIWLLGNHSGSTCRCISGRIASRKDT